MQGTNRNMRSQKAAVRISGKLSWMTIVLIGVLCLQTVFLFYFGSQKTGFHADEIATYTLSNYPGGFVTETDDFVQKWVEGEALYDSLSVDAYEAFNYKMVYQNQERDVHPPLYYYIVHTFSSLFPGHFSKWFGIVPNIIFCLLSSVLLFLISKRLIKNDFLALITVIGFAFSIGNIDQATFIRMYAMLTSCTLLLVFLHLKAFDAMRQQKKISIGVLIALFFCTLIGLLTQYYFSVFALFLCGAFFMYLLFSRKWRVLGAYVVAEFGAIGAAVAYYPIMITHIFGSGYRGQQAFDSLKNTEGFLSTLKTVFQIISNDMLNGWMYELGVLVIVLFVVIFLKNTVSIKLRFVEDRVEIQFGKVQRQGSNRLIRISINFLLMSVLTLVVVGYGALISKVAPFQQDRYYMCLYPLFMLCVVYVFNGVLSLLFSKKLITKGLIMILILFILTLGLVQQSPSYLYPDMAERALAMEEYSEKPAIVLNSGFNWYSMWFLFEYDRFSNVYLSKYAYDDFSSLSHAAETNDLSDGFVLYAFCFPENDEEMLRKIQNFVPVKNYTKLCDGANRVFYCTLEE